MNRKTFTFESKNRKKIRLKDILMLLSVFALCFITVITTANMKNKEEKTIGVTNTAENSVVSDNFKEATQEYEKIAVENNNVSDILPTEQIKKEFISPVNGTIIKPFSKSELIYSNTMDDWRTHLGIDISCPYGTEVLSSEDGEIKNVEYNINYGNTVSLECGEYTLVYTSLSTDVYVNKGDRVKKGTIIGKTSDSCISEICDEPHIHFEVIKNGEHIDPLDIIVFNN